MLDYLTDFAIVLGAVSICFMPIALLIGLFEHFGWDEKIGNFMEQFFSDED